MSLKSLIIDDFSILIKREIILSETFKSAQIFPELRGHNSWVVASFLPFLSDHLPQLDPIIM